jgi:hypothetical protein
VLFLHQQIPSNHFQKDFAPSSLGSMGETETSRNVSFGWLVGFFLFGFDLQQKDNNRYRPISWFPCPLRMEETGFIFQKEYKWASGIVIRKYLSKISGITLFLADVEGTLLASKTIAI